MSQPQAFDELTSQRPPQPWLRWRIVAMLISYSFMTWFNRVSMSVAYVDKIKDETGLLPDEIGLVYSAFFFCYLLMMTPGGWLIDRCGAWTALVIMGFGSALFCAATGIIGTMTALSAAMLLPALLAVRALMGVFSAPVYPGSSRMVGNYISLTQRARANGLIQGAAALGSATAFPVFGLLMDLFTWQVAFMITGGVTALTALVWTFFGPRRQLEPQQTLPTVPIQASPTHWHILFRNRSLMLLTASYAAVGYVEYLFFFWVQFYFNDVLKLGTQESRLYATLLNLGFAAGMIGGGWLTDRLRSAYGGWIGCSLVPVGGMCVGAVCLLLGVLPEATALVVISLAVAWAAIGATEATIWTLAVELGGRHGGTAAALCNTGGNAGGLLAPAITPLISAYVVATYNVSEKTGWQWSIGLSSVIAIVGASLWFWIHPAEKKSSLPA